MAIAYRTEVNDSTRGWFAALVIAAHSVVIYAIAVSLGVVQVPPIVKDSELIFISAPKPVEESPPAPEPQKIKPEVELQTPVPVEAPATDSSPLVEPTDESQSTPVDIPAPPVESASLSVTKRIEPIYPPASRRAGETGQVQLRVLVDESGRPIDVRILKSSGFERLDAAAAEAIRRWLFAPARQGSGPVTAWTQVNVTFQLGK